MQLVCPIRALELAIKGNVHIDLVLEARRKYLEAIDKKEKIQAFIDAEKQYGSNSSSNIGNKKIKPKAGNKKKKQSSASGDPDAKIMGGDGLEGLDTTSISNPNREIFNEGGSGDTAFGLKPKRLPKSEAINNDDQARDLDKELAQSELDIDSYF